VSLRVLYFGTYDRGVGRNAILRDGLRAVGVSVAECHAPVWPDTAAKLSAVRRPGAALGVAARLAATWPRLVRCHQQAGPFDVLLVGATGHPDLLLARRLAQRARQLLVFDPLVSLTETVRDRGLTAPDARWLAALGRLERWLFAQADLTLVDTATHALALATEVGLDPARALVVPVGAPEVYRATADYAPGPPGKPLEVVYFGQYIPLHGLDTVVAAAARLSQRPDIRITLVGRGQRLPEVARRVAELELSNLRLVDAWLTPDELVAQHIAPADVCLGIFGAQPKAARVVPFKVYAALAAGRPVVTADTPALRELLVPGSEVWAVPPADAPALADALIQLADDPGLRQRLANSGRAAYDARFRPAVLGAGLRDALQAALDRRVAQ
jgi:glycosyltransferase involved in cell wall biosynthesis